MAFIDSITSTLNLSSAIMNENTSNDVNKTLNVLSGNVKIIRESVINVRKKVSDQNLVLNTISNNLQALKDNILKEGIKINFGSSKDSGGILSQLNILVSKPKKVKNTAKWVGILIDKIKMLESLNEKKIKTISESFFGGITRLNESIPSGKKLIGIAAGIGAIGLAMSVGFDNVEMKDIIVMNAVFGSLVLYGKLLKGKEETLIKSSLSLGVLGLSIYTFSELVEFTDTLKVSMSLIAIGGALKLFNALVGKGSEQTSKNIIFLSAAVGVLGLSLLVFKNVEYESIGKSLLALGGVGLFAKLLSIAKIDMNDALTVGVLSGSIGLLGLGLQTFENVTVSDVGVALLALGGVGVAAFLLGKLGKSAIIGSITIAAMGISMGVLAFGLQMMKDIDLSLEDVGIIAAVLGATSLAYAAIGIPVVSGLILAGAVAVGSIGGSLLLLSKGLQSINDVNLSDQQIDLFASSVSKVKDIFVNLGEEGGLGSLLSGMAQSGMVSLSTSMLSGAMGTLAKTNMPDETKVNAFKYALNGIKDIYVSFGVMDLLKMTAVTPVLLLVGTTTALLAGSISAFSALSSKPNTVSDAVKSLDFFISGVSDTFMKYDSDVFGKIRKGATSLLGINTMLSGIAGGVSAIGNLEFIEHEIVNGKLVAKSVRRYTPEDFNKVGTSIGNIINALVDPLTKVADAKDSFSIGGIKVTNPFSNKVKSGIEKLSNIGSILTPLTDSISVFAKNNIDDNVIANYQKSISSLINASVSAIMSVKIDDEDTLEDNIDYLKQIVGVESSLFSSVSNNKDAESNMKSISNSIKTIYDSVNGGDIERLSKLQKLFETMNDIEDNDVLKELAESFDNLASAIEKLNNGDVNNNTSNTATKNVSNTNTSKVKESGSKLTEMIEKGNSDVIVALQDIQDTLISGQIRIKPNIAM